MKIYYHVGCQSRTHRKSYNLDAMFELFFSLVEFNQDLKLKFMHKPMWKREKYLLYMYV